MSDETKRFPIVTPTEQQMALLFEVISRGRTVLCNICHREITAKTLGTLLPGSKKGKFIAACDDKTCTLLLFFDWEADQEEWIEYDFIHTEAFKWTGDN